MDIQPNFPYYNTLDQIYHTEWSTAKLARLELLRQSIRTLWPNGHPTKLVHVAGTGGKGSTCRFLEVGLGALGKAGAFMSPHLFDYRERFSIDGQFVSQDDVNAVWQERIQPHCVNMVLNNPAHGHTFHEVSILMALALFEMHGVAWAALEAGVGGRYDQTRALSVAATVLTNVGSDHAHLLGRQLWQRVLDKAGIARPGVPFFTTETHPESRAIIASVCRDAGAPLTWVDRETVSALDTDLEAAGLLPLPDESLLNAHYQRWNAALSLSVIRHFYPTLDPATILARFRDARLPGRFWQVDEGVYADIAHNVEKMRALVDEVQARFVGKGKIMVVGLSGPRAPAEVLGSLAQVAKAIIVTGASYKGQDPHGVRAAIEGQAGETPIVLITDPRQALQIAKNMRTDDDIILLTGSTYMIEQVLNPDPYLRYLHATYGWRDHQEQQAHGEVQLTLPKARTSPI